MSTVTAPAARAALDLIDPGENARELDAEHVKALAASIALRGLIVPLLVSAEGDRYRLIAGHHRLAACESLGLSDVEITLREQQGTSADSAAENVVRKALNPLEEAHAVKRMLEEGYTLDGAATVLGWKRQLVSARARILELPEAAQRLIGSGVLPLSSVGVLERITAVSPKLCEAVLALIAAGEVDGEYFASNPAWVIGRAARESSTGVFAACLTTLDAREIAELRLGKKAIDSYAEAERLHRQLDRYAYGPPPIRFEEPDVDRARAAGVLIEFEQASPIITDRDTYRELARAAVARTAERLRARVSERAERSKGAARRGAREPSARERLDAEHRAASRELSARAHGVNLDLGAALLKDLAAVKPDDFDVARFFAYGLLGAEAGSYASGCERVVPVLAANGIRLVIEEHRESTTPTLKSGKPGVTRVAYGEPEDAERWLWRFIDGARGAGELYGRALVVFAAQAYAHQLVLPAAKRRSPVLPRSRRETARKAFQRLTKPVLPASHVALSRALERESRRYAKACEELATAPKDPPAVATDDSSPEGDAER